LEAFVSGISANSSGTADLINQYLGVTKSKPIDETVNASVTMQDDDDLQWPMSVAGATYRFECRLSYASSTTADLKLQWSVPAGAGMAYQAMGLSTALAYQNLSSVAATNVITFGGNGTGTALCAWLNGIVTVGGTTGTMKLQWAQNTSDATNTRMLAASYGTLWRLS
jgi:hypothetical protein